jgi:GDPmannose 4,6-dehydratase
VGPARRALITGVSGQDGHYLARQLLESGREVLGVSRELPADPVVQSKALDISEPGALRKLIEGYAPDEIYHLAAYHRSSAAVDVSEAEEEQLYFRHNIAATRDLLRSTLELRPTCRVFLAGSCHVFGDAEQSPQNEQTPIRPNSMYGITKADNFWLARYYREKLGLFCVTGILYNHESPRRGPSFVSMRIARAAARIARGLEKELVLGDLEAQVDWGFAGDYTRAMQLMLEAERPNDYVIASGELHRVRELAELAFAHVGLDWQKHVRQGDGLYRPVAKAVYAGDTAAITKELGWSPRMPFAELVTRMVDTHRPGRD